MNTTELRNRGIFGLIFVLILWFGTSYSSLSCSILFTILGLICLYEMWHLRKGKSKILALAYVLIPFLSIQDLIWNYLSFSIFDTQVWMSEFILSLFVLTWTFDTFAFLIGVKYGKHKIMPSISPKKSWEGFIGGLIFTFIASSICFRYFLENSMKEALIYSLILAIIIPFTASLGDFIESIYKRQAGVKDSGNLIPGHGGVLDRMDSLMISMFILNILFRLLS